VTYVGDDGTEADVAPADVAPSPPLGRDLVQRMVAGEVAPPPLVELLGFELVEASGGRAVMELQPRPEHTNSGGIAHGGLTATLIDSVTGCAVWTAIPPEAVIATVDLNVTYARPIPIDGGRLTATATVDHVGRTVAVASCEVRDAQGRVVTLGRATYAVRGR
jgi:uncharacterized protein (TIGR00369 family)